MPRWIRNAVTIVVALNISSVTAHMKTARDKKQLNGKEGMATMKGAWAPPTTMNATKNPLREAQEA